MKSNILLIISIMSTLISLILCIVIIKTGLYSLLFLMMIFGICGILLTAYYNSKYS